MKAYLAGPITGLTYDGAQDWRVAFTRHLEQAGIQGLSPLRGKSYLRSVGVLEAQYLGLHPMSTNKGIVTRDRNDVANADVVVMNLLGAERVSIGTMVELGWADAARVPTIVVMEPEGNIHEHAFVRELAGFVVPDLDEAWAITATICGHDVKVQLEEKVAPLPEVETAPGDWEAIG